jgi:hypothetical protein
VPGGKVVGLLVDVEDFRPSFSNALSQVGIVVQVIASVEHDRIRQKTVAFQVHPLQFELALRVLPTERDNHCQLYPLMAGNLLQLSLIIAL